MFLHSSTCNQNVEYILLNFVYVAHCCSFHVSHQRQTFQKIYSPNGAIYISRISSLLRFENYFAGIMRPYVMSRSDSIDIDEEEDLEYARFLAKRRFK